jgi:isoamylase
MSNEVFYEVHVEGGTKQCKYVPKEHRGKFLGLCSPFMVKHIKSLGVTTVQIMPVFNSTGTYWGYDPISWFDLNPRYGTLREFLVMLKTFHDNGLKVILDVVYNHVANKAKADFQKQGVSFYDWDVTGCGNTVDVRNSLPVIMDSIDYWLRVVGVDGMRFDLGNVLGREGGEFNPQAKFFHELSEYRDKIFTAEPWDCLGYSLGQFPDFIMEFNDQARETLRNGCDYWCDHLPWERSVNFITCHDGYTLHDLIKYDGRYDMSKYKETKAGLLESFDRSSYNKLILAGDEFDNSQNGNHNAYLKGNEESWLDWSKYEAR